MADFAVGGLIPSGSGLDAVPVDSGYVIPKRVVMTYGERSALLDALARLDAIDFGEPRPVAIPNGWEQQWGGLSPYGGIQGPLDDDGPDCD